MNSRLFTIAFLFCFSFGLVAQTTFQNVVAHYPMDGNANDAGTHGFNGTVSGASLTSDRFGNNNSAYHFDGSDDYIETSTQIDNYLGNGASFSAWINISEPHNGRLLSNFNGSGTPGDCVSRIGFVLTVTSDRELAMFYGTDGNDYIGRITDVSQLSMNNWHHVVGVWDGTFFSESFSLFIDGVQQDTFNFELGDVDCGGYLESTNPFYIGLGHCQSGPCGPFLGAIDNVRIFSTAIDLVTINQLYTEANQSIQVFSNGSDFIDVFPNPTTDLLTISFQTEAIYDDSTIELMDISSRVILSQQIQSNKTQISLKDVANKGIYILRVINKKGQLQYSQKIVIQ